MQKEDIIYQEARLNVIKFNEVGDYVQGTLTGVHPSSKYGLVKIDNSKRVTSFQEKPVLSDWINGGFMVASTKLFDYLLSDNTVLEKEPLENLANKGQLTAFKHFGFWHPMDTLRDKVTLETYYNEKRFLWKL
jgi:glucose-1-phosphate cytidylyltransferase